MRLLGKLLALEKQETTVNYNRIYGDAVPERHILTDKYISQPHSYIIQARELADKLFVFHPRFEQLKQYFPYQNPDSYGVQQKIQAQYEIDEIKLLGEQILQYFYDLQDRGESLDFATAYANDKTFACPAGGRENMEAIYRSFGFGFNDLLYNAKFTYLNEIATSFVTKLPNPGMHVHWNAALMLSVAEQYNVKISKDSFASSNFKYNNQFKSYLEKHSSHVWGINHFVRIVTHSVIRNFSIKALIPITTYN